MVDCSFGMLVIFFFFFFFRIKLFFRPFMVDREKSICSFFFFCCSRFVRFVSRKMYLILFKNIRIDKY